MPPTSSDEQFKFLISCIRYSNNGKVDFQEVANECNIVSKGAAAKRYERMMKQHGIHPNGSTNRDTAMTPAASKASPYATTTTPAKASKKRKLDQLTEGNTNTDDDEGLSKVKAESSNTTAKTETMKEEEISAFTKDTPTFTPANRRPSALGLDGADDEFLMSDFLSFGAFGGHENESKVTGSADTGKFVSAGVTPVESIIITE